MLPWWTKAPSHPFPHMQDTADVRRFHCRHLHDAITVEVCGADGVDPAVGDTGRRRRRHLHQLVVTQSVDRHRRTQIHVGAHHDHLIAAVAVQIGKAWHEILKHLRIRQAMLDDGTVIGPGARAG